MATINLENLKFKTVELSLIMDRSPVKITSLVNSIYSSGASKWSLKCNVVATTPADREFIQGLVVGSLYYNNDFLITLPPELIKSTANITTRTRITSGDITVASPSSGGKNGGEYFNVETAANVDNPVKNKLYCVVNTTRNSLNLYPRIGASVTPSRLNFTAPKVRCLLLNSNATMKTIVNNDYYRELQLTFESV